MTTLAIRSRRPVRAVSLLLLGVVILAGLALSWAGPAHAEPSPAPGPPATAPGTPPTPGVPDPGVRPPGVDPSPPAPATPAPTPGPSPTPGQPSVDDDPAWYDIGGQIRKAVVELVVWTAEQALQPVMEALGASWLSTPDLTNNEHVKAIWTTSLITANGVFVLFIVANGFLITTRETLQSQHGLKQVLPRIALGAVLANGSLLIGQQAIMLTNALTVAIAGNTVDGPAAAAAIGQIADNALQGKGFLMVLLAVAVVVMCLLVEFTFILRLAALVILVGLAPAALICHASPLTEGIAHTWWRAFAACLGLQIGQAIIVMATVKVFLTPAGPTVLGVPSTADGLLGVLVCLTMLWLLIKLPGWMRQFVLGPLGQRNGRGLLGQLMHAYLTIKTLGAAAGILGGANAARTAGRTAPRPPGPRPLPGGRRGARDGGGLPTRGGAPRRRRPCPGGRGSSWPAGSRSDRSCGEHRRDRGRWPARRALWRWCGGERHRRCRAAGCRSRCRGRGIAEGDSGGRCGWGRWTRLRRGRVRELRGRDTTGRRWRWRGRGRRVAEGGGGVRPGRRGQRRMG
ncbi:hypothetical protein, partial [Micromonospora orduensis]|uniref:hypothetical protein n=1 Tax=Micromonospora orduensis TaxID=1420891 RepID=UPI001FCC8B30